MAIGFYKVLELPEIPQPSSIYYLVEVSNESEENEEIIHKAYLTTKTSPAEYIPLNAITVQEFVTELNKKYTKPSGSIHQYIRGDGSLGESEILGLNSTSVLFVEQDLSLDQQAQARENVGVTESSYYQRFDWNSTTNPTKEFLLDFIPKNINYVVNTNAFLWMDDNDYEIVGTTLRILTTNIANGAIIRINYTHE